MHDIDTTRLEVQSDLEQFPLTEAESEAESYEGEEEQEGFMSEEEEETLAAELLGVTNEEEMDQFLGGLFKKISKKVRNAASFLAKNAGPFSGVLKNVAARGLPFLTGALGTAIPIPGVGTALGAAIGKAAGNLLQSEMGEVDSEDQEFELSKRYVRLASQAIRHAARRPYSPNPNATANLAVRRVLQRWRRAPHYYLRPRLQACPPCPPCPPCPEFAEPAPAAVQSAGAPGPAPGSTAAAQEMEWESEGLMEGEYVDESGSQAESEGETEGDFEMENYETQPTTSPASAAHRSNGGRWVRRGKRIILYGA